MRHRSLLNAVQDAIGDTPVVFIHGSRQVGKTTLVHQAIEAGHPARFVSLDDAANLAAAESDPAGFLAGFDGPVAIDEVQRVPELLLAIKAQVDRRREPGRYLLTGSSNVLTLPRVADSLAGRIEIINLWPFSQGEIAGTHESFIDRVFAPEFKPGRVARCDRAEAVSRILRGGYPEAVGRRDPLRRAAWFNSYINAILQRDVRELANIERLEQMPRLLEVLASRTANLLSYTDVASAISLPQATLKRYFALLEQVFLVQRLPAWSGNLGLRMIKSPKVYLVDTGLAAALLGLDDDRLANQPTLLGPLLENFVMMEVRKQLGWSRTRARAYHFRTSQGREVDLVLEAPGGDVVGIEVKAGATVGVKDFAGLKVLAEAAGKRFRRGVVLHLGTEAVSFGKSLFALPLGSLWQREL